VSNVLRDLLRAPGLDDAIDEGALLSFLDAAASEDPARTVYRAVRILPPGHTLIFEGDEHRTRMFRHWRFPVPAELRLRDPREYPRRYRAVLSLAVAERVRGERASLLLSGGLDSASIAAGASDAGVAPGLHAFTAGYPTLVEHDEVPLARATAASLGIPLTHVACDAGEPLAAPQLQARPLDEPMLAGWRTLIHAAAGHATTILHGEDGDALFVPPGWLSMRAAAPSWRIAAAAAAFALGQRRLPYLGVRLRERLGLVPSTGVAECGWLTPCARRALAQLEPVHVLGHTATALPVHPTRPAAQARLTEMICTQLAPAISGEATGADAQLRYPLLDSRVITFVMSVPPIPWCQGKRLPRRAYRGRLPAAVLDRRKRGIAGVNEALVATWRRRTLRRPPALHPALERWVDEARWRSILESGSTAEVMAAWRVLELGAWLEQGMPAGRRACTR
jgi:asparagine synthase (glutamine-hydrolysing)